MRQGLFEGGAERQEQRLGSWWSRELHAEWETSGLVSTGGHGEDRATGLRERNDVAKEACSVERRIPVAKRSDAGRGDRQQGIRPQLTHL